MTRHLSFLKRLSGKKIAEKLILNTQFKSFEHFRHQNINVLRYKPERAQQ